MFQNKDQNTQRQPSEEGAQAPGIDPKATFSPPGSPPDTPQVEKSETKQQKQLQSALGSITPSVAKVETIVPVEGAKQVFVVIREMHQNDQLPEDMQDSAKRSQAQVFSVLKTLAKDLGKVSVLKDGMSPDIAKNYDERIAHFYEHATLVKTLEREIGTSSSSETEALLAKMKDAGADAKIMNAVGFLAEYQKNRESLFEEAKNDGAINLALRKVITLAGPENPDLVKASLALAEDNPQLTIDDPRFKALSDKREAHVFSRVTKSTDSVVLSVFGGSHSFQDEIATWNKQHPDKKIGLIEITTAEYVKTFKD